VTDLHRYWLTFRAAGDDELPPGASMGVGVTAVDLDDAFRLVSRVLFGGADLPEIQAVVTDVDVSTLDAGHVLPNMHVPSERGVWFPMTTAGPSPELE
jgi:hypothetical protein